MLSWHDAPPPFNPLYKPHAKLVREKVTKCMEEKGFYKSHTREECKVEWNRLYDKMMLEHEL
jgi:hypothetical protein